MALEMFATETEKKLDMSDLLQENSTLLFCERTGSRELTGAGTTN